MAITMNKREKYAVSAGGALVCLFVIIQFIVMPFINRQTRLEKTVAAKQNAIERMHALKAEYEAIEKKANVSQKLLARRKRGFTLFSLISLR